MGYDKTPERYLYHCSAFFIINLAPTKYMNLLFSLFLIVTKSDVGD